MRLKHKAGDAADWFMMMNEEHVNKICLIILENIVVLHMAAPRYTLYQLPLTAHGLTKGLATVHTRTYCYNRSYIRTNYTYTHEIAGREGTWRQSIRAPVLSFGLACCPTKTNMTILRGICLLELLSL